MHGQPPVIIEAYDPAWPLKFEAERVALESVLRPWLVGAIEHVGSTAVPGLAAKPIIDMMAPVRDLASSAPAIDALRALSYGYFPHRADEMHWFCKPSDVQRTHHLYLVPWGSRLWHERLAFRELLRRDETVRRDYATLKSVLARQHRDDREAYTEAKTAFIRSALR